MVKVPPGVTRIERKLDWITTGQILRKARNLAFEKLDRFPFEDPRYTAAAAEYNMACKVLELYSTTPHHLFEIRTSLLPSLSFLR